jgi:N6-adenosine-specific RNA methylase IME4
MSDRARYRVLVADPPWAFGDKLTMSKVRRGAEANYGTLTTEDLLSRVAEEVFPVMATDSVCALWCPMALLGDGLNVLRAWKYVQKQALVWVKTAKGKAGLAFGMGHHFRGCAELVLFGVRGKVAPKVRNERNVFLSPALPHSRKPEDLQDALERMYPGPRLELFARRERDEWTCLGNECPTTPGEDICESLRSL